MIEKVLVGTDGSATATKAVERAVAVARSAKASLTILSVGRDGERIAKEAASVHEGAGVVIEA